MNLNSREWVEDDWQNLMADLVSQGIVSWQEIAAVVLGSLNPPQVGTSLASNKILQSRYEFRKTWQAVRSWLYAQPPGCRQCGTLLGIEAEHIVPRQHLGDEVWHLDNMQLLCKRCNAKKRPSHKNAGVTHLTSESALMWILLVHKPGNYQEYRQMCRVYGLTMADIRFQESWAFVEWRQREV